MSEPCEKGDLISGTPHFTLSILYVSTPCLLSKFTEYVGELIFDPTFHSREWVYPSYTFEFWNVFIWPQISGVAVHKGRSYVFQLNSTFSLDSGWAGNETRYINHSSTSPNCGCIGTSSYIYLIFIDSVKLSFSPPLSSYARKWRA